ncbi:MAG: LacI family transcriptional regulator, partial [Xanthomonadales bacterium]|nr:LacI family transcriptional regulator [Xanthomonadales bacterium]
VVEGQPGISVGCDNLDGGRAVTAHLIGLGRKRIAFVGSIGEQCPEFLDRYRGYCAAHEAAGL